MKKVSALNVYFNGFSQKQLVGTLALIENRFAAFEYSNEWLSNGFSISPFSLPLEKKVFVPEFEPFSGLHGVFNDSLPDGWGRLLVDRLLQRNGINPHELSVLDRLAIVGSSGMGALSYEPESFIGTNYDLPTDLDTLSLECNRILTTELSNDDKKNLDAIFLAGGSSGGARPKIFTKIDDEDWIIKFPSSVDPLNIGKQEYNYCKTAKKCGIEVSDVKLFESRKCKGYFGTKRFDRDGKKRIHMVSASALLETSHRIPNLDYNTLMLLTLQLTKSNSELLKLYKLMCFNVYAHNRDDHSKNFSWLFDEQKGIWKLSPAYDLTYSNSIGGEHATTIDGEGLSPKLEHLLCVAKKAGLKTIEAQNIAKEIEKIVKNDLLM